MPRALPDRGSVRREELLDDLIALFLAEGFAGLSVGELAARMRCSRSTLYLVAPSKEQLVVEVVRTFFRRAADRIEARLAACPDPAERLGLYLTAVAEELEPASESFYADLAGFRPGADVYRENTRFAARRVQELVAEGVDAGVLRSVDASFVGAAVSQVMSAIQNGEIEAATGLVDADAYRHLADLVLHSLSAR